jgi:hypothetical protein
MLQGYRERALGQQAVKWSLELSFSKKLLPKMFSRGKLYKFHGVEVIQLCRRG